MGKNTRDAKKLSRNWKTTGCFHFDGQMLGNRAVEGYPVILMDYFYGVGFGDQHVLLRENGTSWSHRAHTIRCPEIFYCAKTN